MMELGTICVNSKIFSQKEKMSLISMVIDALSYVLLHLHNFPFTVLKDSWNRGASLVTHCPGSCLCQPELGLASVCVRDSNTTVFRGCT